jgi:Flp pilus assembly pilin Flp
LLTVISLLVERLKRQDGQTVVEYALVIGGVSLVLITFLAVGPLQTVFNELITNIDQAMTGDAGP